MHTGLDDILSEAASGNLRAFERIYKINANFVYNIAFRITNNKELAEEITQDVFLKIYKNLKNFRFRASFKTWIYRITVNTAINTLKREAAKWGRRIHYEEYNSKHSAAEAVRERLNKEENEIIIKKLLSYINPEQRACVILKDIEGLTYKEISKTLKININTVRSRLKRARITMLKNIVNINDIL